MTEALIRPFAALRPAPELAADVVAPPYDVLSSDEARERASGRPWSFLHISKPEIDLPAGTDVHSPPVYAKAAENLRHMLDAGVLCRDARPAFYAWRMAQSGHEQTGIAFAASVAAYDVNRIRKHEFTRPDKEDDRVRQIEALDAQTGPVLLAYPDAPAIDAVLETATAMPPEVEVVADTGVRHSLWVIDTAQDIAALMQDFENLPALYIADGHHRSAAASRVAAQRRRQGRAGAESGFLAVAFPQRQMQILPYNRLVRDLNGRSAAVFLAQVGQHFALEPSAMPVTPARPGEFGLYLDRRWHRLRLPASAEPPTDPVARLDVSLLADWLLAPLLGITDPRRDQRIDFVGGIRGLDELVRRVDSGEMACAVSMFPTRMEDLMAVADAGNVMPPKSTWFEPKLADGLLSLVLD